jgi:hypothetical protein
MVVTAHDARHAHDTNQIGFLEFQDSTGCMYMHYRQHPNAYRQDHNQRNAWSINEMHGHQSRVYHLDRIQGSQEARALLLLQALSLCSSLRLGGIHG